MIKRADRRPVWDANRSCLSSPLRKSMTKTPSFSNSAFTIGRYASSSTMINPFGGLEPLGVNWGPMSARRSSIHSIVVPTPAHTDTDNPPQGRLTGHRSIACDTTEEGAPFHACVKGTLPITTRESPRACAHAGGSRAVALVALAWRHLALRLGARVGGNGAMDASDDGPVTGRSLARLQPLVACGAHPRRHDRRRRFGTCKPS